MRTEDWPAITRVKGLAILFVVCIHSKVLIDVPYYESVINRAVPVFLVLFGVTSELWWGRRTSGRESAPSPKAGLRLLREWYRTRLGRLIPAYWVWVTVWLLAADAWANLTFINHAAGRYLYYTGYAPLMGTSWFVTTLLQFIAVFPLLRALAVTRAGWLLLPLFAAVSHWSTYHLWDIVAAGKAWMREPLREPNWYYFWIFGPRYLWAVTAGLFFARWRARKAIMLACLPLVLAEPLLSDLIRRTAQNWVEGDLRAYSFRELCDPALAFALLGVLGARRVPKAAAVVLEWLGRNSWRIYVGHALLYEVVHLTGNAPEVLSLEVRAGYTLILLGAGVAFAAAAALGVLLWRKVGRERVVAPAS